MADNKSIIDEAPEVRLFRLFTMGDIITVVATLVIVGLTFGSVRTTVANNKENIDKVKVENQKQIQEVKQDLQDAIKQSEQRTREDIQQLREQQSKDMQEIRRLIIENERNHAR